MAKIIDFSGYDGDDRVISGQEMKVEIANRKRSTVRFYSRIPALDKLLDGFEPGELIAVSGYTKHGKSLLGQSITLQFFNQNIFSLWFTFELPPDQFLSRFGDNLPLLYLPRIHRRTNLPWLTERIREAVAKYAVQAVFCDHLHYIVDIARSRNPSLDIGHVIRTLKSLAIELEVVIFLMCHTQQPKSAGPEAGYEALRDSSFIAQESDVVLMVQRRPERGENVATISVEFSRRTGVMRRKVWVEKVCGLLRETTIREDAPKNGNGAKRYWDD